MYTFLESEFAKAITQATGSLHPFLPALSLAASGNLRRKDLVEIEIQRLEEQEQLRSTIIGYGAGKRGDQGRAVQPVPDAAESGETV